MELLFFVGVGDFETQTIKAFPNIWELDVADHLGWEEDCILLVETGAQESLLLEEVLIRIFKGLLEHLTSDYELLVSNMDNIGILKVSVCKSKIVYELLKFVKILVFLVQ